MEDESDDSDVVVETRVLVNASFKVDQDHLTCSNDECSRRPLYGILYGKPIFCKEHRMNGYIDVVSKRWLCWR